MELAKDHSSLRQRNDGVSAKRSCVTHKRPTGKSEGSREIFDQYPSNFHLNVRRLLKLRNLRLIAGRDNSCKRDREAPADVAHCWGRWFMLLFLLDGATG